MGGPFKRQNQDWQFTPTTFASPDTAAIIYTFRHGHQQTRPRRPGEGMTEWRGISFNFTQS